MRDEGLEAIIQKHWSRGLLQKSASADNATRFKLRGNFIAVEANGDAAAEARLFMANLHEELLARGHECVASLDTARSKFCQDFMIFRGINRDA